MNPFRVLHRHRNFRVFWIGQTVSLVGTWMQTMARGWLAYDLTSSVVLLAVVSVAGSLPILLFSLPAGVLVDRYPKLRIVTVAQALLMVEAALLWWFTWSGHVTIGWLVTLATLQGVVTAVEIPARQSLIIELVGREDLRDAIALNSGGFNLARVVGPSLGAAVIAGAGLAWCFALNALSYAAVLAGLTRIRLPAWRPTAQRVAPLEGIVQLLRYVRTTRAVSGLMGIVTVYSVLGVPYLTLMPVVARDLLHMRASGYGLLLTSVGVGGLAGALSLAALGPRVPRGRLLALSTHGFAALLILFAATRSVGLAYAVLLLTGFAMILNNATANALLQSVVPDAMRGRLMAAYSLVVVGLSQAFGSLVAGSLAEALGVSWAIAGTAVLMLAYSAWAFRRHPEIQAL